MQRTAHVFHVHVAEEFAVDRDLARDLREGKVVAISFSGNVSVDLVGRKVALVRGEMYLYGALDHAEVHISVIGVDVDPAIEVRRSHIAMSGMDGDMRALRDCHR